MESLGRSASLDERITLMEDFTSTLSLCSNGSLSQEMSVFSMWTASTRTLSWVQMLSVVGVHQRRVGIMRRSMGTLLRGDSKDPEVGFLRLALYGLQSSFQKIERAFLKLSRDWLREHFCVTSLPSDVMLIGNIGGNQNPTLTLATYRSTQRSFQDSIHGYNKIWWDMDLTVSASLRSKYTFLTWAVWAGALPPARGSRPGHPSVPLCKCHPRAR
ncbi:putative ORF3 protein [Giant panda associated gemycircularvirus]|uniref:Putative ORF3 protein n=1 Tax=Giant panda associated gemycircularvirus TaxID=2016461 RepID=A0A220IGR9_9VIRU|nr:putative ORF3 protein [Giant panda associated gemycircularvirus]ASH99177.1 putative ORF3 protein [Giant panda associated gemycircularvirus]